MKENNFEGRYVSPEEIQEYVLTKFEDSMEHHERYHEFFIDSCIGYSPEKSSATTNVSNAIIAVKYNTEVIYIRIVDGKILGTHPDEFYLVYRTGKHLACGLRQAGNETFIRIKENDDCSADFDMTVFIMIQHEGGIFTLFYTPDKAMFTEPFITGNEEKITTLMKSVKRFFCLPSNFRSVSKNAEDSEDDDE